jgi:hypothetical protein
MNEISYLEAIISLSPGEWVVYGSPTTAEEFSEMVFKVVGQDESGSAILSNDPEDVNLDWSTVNNKYNELVNAQPLTLLRKERNRYLAETDWWASSDLTMTEEQINYRQALRDITDKYSSLDEVVWPIKPHQVS